MSASKLHQLGVALDQAFGKDGGMDKKEISNSGWRAKPDPVAPPMSDEERAMQAKKIELIERMVICLEEIAFRVTPSAFEKPDYLKYLYNNASRKH
jgi:hypothetical protein